MRAAPALLSMLLTAGLCACGPATTQTTAVKSEPAAEKKLAPLPLSQRLKRGLEHFEASRYKKAEADFRAAAEGKHRDQARLGLAQVLLMTGRYAEAVETARKLTKAEQAIRHQAVWLQGEALRRQGKVEEAEAVLRPVTKEPEARRARLLLGEVLLEMGRRGDADQVLTPLFEDYSSDRISDEDGPELAMVGRAAHLLRMPRNANNAFNEAERVLESDIRTLLWRAELFLEKYDPGHAEEVTKEALEKAPNHPEALVWMAHVKLAQALDFDAAERLAQEALAVDPKIAGAHFVLAGIALRDMELEQADERADAGLKYNPRHLDLLSFKAAVRFLADDQNGFEQAKQRVLALNPTYSRMFQIIGEYAEWEHRYDEIVEMMEEAVVIDGEDAKARATLGLNLIRAGDEPYGLAELKRAFDRDEFNVRVYNTLLLFKELIPEHYVTVKHELFTIRYHQEEKEILERYVPQLLEQAWKEMVDSYDFTPETPVGIELYAERQNFAIRTSGLPNTGIQGVCFGKTLAAMSPMNETFNLGMTLWHELAHVFHIQLSKSHVPRWFTEGLAELETLVVRPEWKRERDPDLYAAFRARRLPRVGVMNRAFTRAEHIDDIAVAYYASTQILVMLEKKFGRKRLAEMLKLWGEGLRTPQVVQKGLGVTPAELDRLFREYLTERLARYASQFVPISRTAPLKEAKAAANKAPKDPDKQTRYALAALRAGKTKAAKRALARALKANPKYADALWLSAQIARKKRQRKAAQKLLRQLLDAGHDGYVVQMALAELALGGRDLAGAQAALRAAHRFDPTMAEPLRALAEIANQQGRADDELASLRKLAKLEQHEPGICRRLMQLLLERKLLDEAREVGEAGVYADVSGMRMHQLFAEVLVASRMIPRAIYELESAILCPGRPKEQADAHAQLAETYLVARKRAAAKRHAKRARELDPNNPRLGKLRL